MCVAVVSEGHLSRAPVVQGTHGIHRRWNVGGGGGVCVCVGAGEGG
jgi:hypothetical protein